jgi:glycosyltransferase involved in cell wall biosynthesis
MELEKAGIKVITLRRRFRFDFSIVFQIASILRKQSIDILHMYMFTANFWGTLAGIIARTPVLIASERDMAFWKSKIHYKLDYLISVVVDRFIVNAKAIKDELISLEKFSANKITVIHNGIYDDEELIPKDQKTNRKIIIGNISRYDKKKDILGLLKVISMLKSQYIDIELRIMGDAYLPPELEYKKRVIKYIVENGLSDSVVLCGKVDDVRQRLNEVDIVVQASTSEGFPNAVMEAMIMGCPVIATRVGGTDELVVDEVSGYLTEIGDYKDMAKKVEYLSANYEFRLRMGKQCRDRILNNFTNEMMVDKTQQIYEESLMKES